MVFVDSSVLQGIIASSLNNMVRWPHPSPNYSRKRLFAWTNEADSAFLALKSALVTTPVLHLLDSAKRFTVDCDASGAGFGADLHQDGGPIAFFNRTVAPHHAKLATY